MKLGVMIEGQEGVGWTEWKQIVQWTEELGFESLWRSDHFFSFSRDRRIDALETFASLVHVAENTRRIRFGTLVCSMTFRHPAIVARMAAAIDQLSGGRLILGLGAGWNVAEHEAFGIALPPPGPRIDALEEGTRVIKALFADDPASFAGKHFQIKDAYLHPKPAQTPLPILIGGSGEKKTLRVVALLADEWNAIGMGTAAYRQKVEVLEAHCEQVKRDPQAIARSLMCSYVTGENEAEVRRRVEARPGPVREGVFVGTPAQIVEQIQAYEAEGVSRIMMQHFTPPSRQQLELLAKEILPKV